MIIKAVGIIAEYNPFHNGHLFQMNEAKRLTGREYVIVVMSGNYVQRGEPAVIDKWRRTRIALEQGADAVLELPSFYSVAAADYFARGAVRMMTAAGVVDCLCFGSECGTVEPLEKAADVLINEPPVFINTLKEKLGEGKSYAAARGAALEAALPNLKGDGLFSLPNNNLAVEYIKAIKITGSDLKPVTVLRDRNFLSASKIREMILNGDFSGAQKNLPYNDYNRPCCLDGYSQFFKEFLVRSNELYKINLLGEPECCLNTPDFEGGLAVRFFKEAARHEKISNILAAVKSKRFTYTRLQRTVMHLILGITKGDMLALENAGGPPYLRVLGFRRESGPLIREMANNASLPVVIDVATARKRLSQFALKVFEREAKGEFSKPVIKI